MTALGSVLVVCGIPAGIRAAVSAFSRRDILRAVAAWTTAAVPAVILTVPWF